MASSLISSSHHVYFDSVFGMDDAALVQMFESLIETGLKEFLGCPAVFYEAALTEFFTNGSVREDGMVVSTIRGTTIEISDSLFATAFDLPTEGLTDLSDVPMNLVFDARSLFSDSKEQVSISCLKKELKIQYRLLHDTLAKTIYVKAGSFDAVTRDRFMLMPAITCDVKVNWSNLLFNVLKEMVTPGSIQAKGFAIQICEILKTVPRLVLVESRVFPASRVLTEKTIHRYVAVNDKVGGEADTDAPRVNKIPVKRAVSHKRPAVDIEAAPVVKKKRTTKGKPLVIAQEMVPLQIVEAAADAPVEQPPVPKRKSQNRKRRLILEDDLGVDEPVAGRSTAEHPVKETTTGVQEPVPESVEQPVVVPSQNRKRRLILEDDLGVDEPVAGRSTAEHPVKETTTGVQEPVPESVEQPVVVPVVAPATDDPDAVIKKLRTMIRVDGVWVVEPFCDQWVKIPRPVVCTEVSRQCSSVDFFPVLSEPFRLLRKRWADDCLEAVKFCASRRLLTVGSLNCRALAIVEPDSSFAYRQPTVFALHFSQFCTVYIQYSLFSWLPTADITDFLSSIAMDRKVFRSVQIAQNTVSVAPIVQLIDEHSSSDSTSDDISMDFVDHDTTAATSHSPPTISADVQNVLAQLRASVDLIQFELLEHKDDVKKIRETLSLHINNLERTLSDIFDAHDRTYSVLFNNVRHDMRDHKNLLLMDLKSYQQKVSIQVGASALDTVDIRREVKAMNAKVDILSSRLDDVKKDVEATKEAIYHLLLEFQSQAQDNHIILTDQLGQLVDYINRGGNAKKGEGESSRGPQPPHAVQIRDSGNAGCSGML
ncbi:hypothetical protein F511_16506 [Dorcoceras hygrometricum]|uniref:Dystroglycan-like n=1 Tax=Dorcoceras hygrometricum TaxID=472368 RepID=A0A2Z7CTI5_9LAMI|nr:hypothetical protein F511_16506 [Dorcoceras hygrometricum]